MSPAKVSPSVSQQISVVMQFFVSCFTHVMRFVNSLPFPVRVLCSCLLLYLPLPVFLLPALLLFAFRGLLILVFQFIYLGKYKLMSPTDVVHTFDSNADIDTINFFMYINGPCDIDLLRWRILKALRFEDDTGAKPYWKLSHRPVTKFLFRCWKNEEKSINLKHHVRYCPGASNPKKIYSENELFELASEFACHMWDERRPKWEFLITPQVKLQDRNKVCSSILFRISHEYGDGISLMQFQRHVLFDPPAPNLIFDPVNPPIPPIPLYVRILWTLQTLFLGPSAVFKFLAAKGKSEIYKNGPMTGPKFMGRTNMEISLEMTRRIRKSLKCSTSAIFHSAFCGAMRKLAKEKKLPIPSEAIGGMAHAVVPYPDDHLHNHFVPIATEFPLGIGDPIERLRVTDKRVKQMLQPHSLDPTWYAYSLLGIYPTRGMEIGIGEVSCLYAISNVPGVIGTAKFDGNEVEMIFGSPPSCIGINFMVGIGCYNGKFAAGFLMENSSLVKSQKDLDDLISEFEQQLRRLDKEAKSLQNVN